MPSEAFRCPHCETCRCARCQAEEIAFRDGLGHLSAGFTVLAVGAGSAFLFTSTSLTLLTYACLMLWFLRTRPTDDVFAISPLKSPLKPLPLREALPRQAGLPPSL